LTKLYANAKLVRNFRIDVDDGESHAFCLDLSPPEGTGMGPSALELALMSYAGCYATIFVRTAKKMRLALNDLEVKSEAIKSQEAGTITEVDTEIIVRCDAPEDRIQRVHHVTVRNCPVGILFEKANVNMRYNIKREKEQT